jgi:hypothetical protein
MVECLLYVLNANFENSTKHNLPVSMDMLIHGALYGLPSRRSYSRDQYSVQMGGVALFPKKYLAQRHLLKTWSGPYAWTNYL